MDNEIKKNRIKNVRLAKMGMLAAISIVLVFLIRFPILPGFTFLEYDPADIPILIGAFAFGPLSGLILTVAVSVVQGITVSAIGGPWGILMHIIATGTLVLVAGGIYRHNKTRKMAVIALALGAIAMTVVMCAANIIITPIYTGWPRDAVIGIIAPAIIPFNLIKAGINGVITFVVYKKISKFLHN